MYCRCDVIGERRCCGVRRSAGLLDADDRRAGGRVRTARRRHDRRQHASRRRLLDRRQAALVRQLLHPQPGRLRPRRRTAHRRLRAARLPVLGRNNQHLRANDQNHDLAVSDKDKVKN